MSAPRGQRPRPEQTPRLSLRQGFLSQSSEAPHVHA